ncbi:hypothetical protein [Kitasatospora aureofaciens]|uniref:hypothetical protein n=1 Tax=Kitasatospora aureofaciens TaxID=1894 RepID=UPI001C493893|nr:hypothetical protein [Kitasatospora aureofaciens]MBV6698138.1 hypothetical protein [Kitasatospora aureofaciens]
MKATLRLGGLAGSLALGTGLALVPAVQAHAASTFVSCGDVTGLRNAINAFNAAGSGDIALQSGCTYTVVDVDNGNNGLPAITGAIRIASNGATIARSGAPGTPDFRLFFVAPGGKLTLDQVNLTGGHPGSSGDIGGAAYNHGSLTVAGATVSGNHAAVGGGIYNDAGSTVELDGATINSNTATKGGGLANAGQLNVAYSTVRGNTASDQGGGVLNAAGTTNIVGSQVTGNTAGTNGGGVYVSGGHVSLLYSNVSGNTPNNCRPVGAVAGCVN